MELPRAPSTLLKRRSSEAWTSSSDRSLESSVLDLSASQSSLSQSSGGSSDFMPTPQMPQAQQLSEDGGPHEDPSSDLTSGEVEYIIKAERLVSQLRQRFMDFEPDGCVHQRLQPVTWGFCVLWRWSRL